MLVPAAAATGKLVAAAVLTTTALRFLVTGALPADGQRRVEDHGGRRRPRALRAGRLRRARDGARGEPSAHGAAAAPPQDRRGRDRGRPRQPDQGHRARGRRARAALTGFSARERPGCTSVSIASRRMTSSSSPRSSTARTPRLARTSSSPISPPRRRSGQRPSQMASRPRPASPRPRPRAADEGGYAEGGRTSRPPSGMSLRERRESRLTAARRTLDLTGNVVLEFRPRRRPLLAAAADRPASRARSLQPTPRRGIASSFDRRR